MDCNRDEATRAKAIAETKFSAKDIMGAKKFALKAQSLYPGLDGISQLLAILDVYVAAENKINGELDYYEILGVNPLADDDTIRKHYRKLALSLHPDKNKSIGADGAFKYVSEAWNLLSDKDKRTTYDHKRNARVFTQKVRTSNGGSGAPPTSSAKNGFYNFTKSTTTRTKSTTPQTKGTTPQTKGTTPQTKGTTPQTKSTTTQTKSTTNSPKDNMNAANKKDPMAVQSSANKQTGPTPTSVPSPSYEQITQKTFWTVCKRCKLQYEFVRMYLNRNLLCPTCHGPFLAVEIPPPNTNGSSEIPEKGHGARENGSNPKSNITISKWAPFLKTASPAAVSQAASMVQEAYEKPKRDREEVQSATKRRRKISKKEASSSSKHSNSVKTKAENKETRPVGSSISAGQVDIKKDIANAGIKNQLMKKATMEIRKKLHEWSSEKGNGTEKADGLVNGDSNDHRTETVSTDVPDPDFHDFDRNRSETCFEEGQVWAVYDDHDGMPRYYAVIQKVISTDPFKMKVCWLNSTPNNKNPKMSSGFLKAFGEFKTGKHETVSVPNYFSHKANFTKLANGNIRVFPREKDVCALYRNDRQQKYEIVEVDEYDEETGGMTVTPLIKVADFKTVFHRHINPKETRVVSENEMVRFSHKIPSYLLTGKESANAPKGCFELDPAAIPAVFLQVGGGVKEDGDDVEMVKEEFVSK